MVRTMTGLVRALMVALAFGLSAAAAHGGTGPVAVQLALSEIKREQLPPPSGTIIGPVNPDPTMQVPAPEPVNPHQSPLDDVNPTGPDDPANPGGPDGDSGVMDPARPNIDPNAPLPAIEYDLSKLPAAVLETHTKIVEAARTGKIDNLRTLIGSGQDVTQFALSGDQEDPLGYLLSLSGDEGGQEILAILLEILSAGYVHLDAGTPQELYVWPYFFAIPLDKLNEMQRVELFKIVTSGDVEDMKSFGAYIFYRAGISPDGKWRFFLAGE